MALQPISPAHREELRQLNNAASRSLLVDSDDERRARIKAREHVVSIIINGREIDGWSEYQIDSSLTEPADSFSLTRPFDWDAWQLCRRDARVRVTIDGICIINGFVDSRARAAKAGTLTITGRDICGRLLDESAPRTRFGGLDMKQTIEQLASPWFRTITFTNARNRKVRRGKGHQVPSGSEAIQLPPRPKNQRIDPGKKRWEVISEMISAAGLICWSSADGLELFVGKPNHKQEPQYLFMVSSIDSAEPSTVLDMRWEENNADRYAQIISLGTGANSDADYGEAVTTRKGSVVDNDSNSINGTGRDFLYPKQLRMVEQTIRDNDEASRFAAREQARRDFRRTVVTVEMPYHGQTLAGTRKTMFAPDTIARVVDEEIDEDELMMIYSCSYRSSRSAGETTTLMMVPKGTEIVA